MKARSFSHTGITVADFDRFVQFYAEHFGCRLVAVGDSEPAWVRGFFGVDAEITQSFELVVHSGHRIRQTGFDLAVRDGLERVGIE